MLSEIINLVLASLVVFLTSLLIQKSQSSKKVEVEVDESDGEEAPSTSYRSQIFICKTSKHVYHIEGCKYLKGKKDVKEFYVCDKCYGQRKKEF
jgi:hypothetical protein